MDTLKERPLTEEEYFKIYCLIHHINPGTIGKESKERFQVDLKDAKEKGWIKKSALEEADEYIDKVIEEMNRKELPHRVCYDKKELIIIKSAYHKAIEEIKSK